MGCWWRRKEKGEKSEPQKLAVFCEKAKQKGEECELRVQAAAAEGRGTEGRQIVSWHENTEWKVVQSGHRMANWVFCLHAGRRADSQEICMRLQVSFNGTSSSVHSFWGTDSLVQNIRTHAQADALGGRNWSDRGTLTASARLDLKGPVWIRPRYASMPTTGQLRSISSDGRGALFLKDHIAISWRYIAVYTIEAIKRNLNGKVRGFKLCFFNYKIHSSNILNHL